MIDMENTSVNLYKIPVKKNSIEKIVTKQGMLSAKQKSHLKNLKNSIDFVVPAGTEVFAALDGEVTTMKDDSDAGGPDKKYWYDGNFIVIKHANGEFSYYEHFKFKGVAVKVGDRVKTGQLIGHVGMTGYTFRPHLHFDVFVWPYPTAKPKERETVKVRFEDFSNIYEVGE